MNSQNSNLRLTDLLNLVFKSHAENLIGHKVTIILCGSIPSTDSPSYHDIDYIVLVDRTDYETLKKLSSIRLELKDKLALSISNTVVNSRLADSINTNMLTIDSKAIQALIEASGRPERIISTHEYRLIKPKDNSIKKYSAYNFFIIRSQVYKHIVRSDIKDYEPFVYKFIKLSAIALKMYIQFFEPKFFINDNEISQNKNTETALKLYKELERSKSGPDQTSKILISQTLEYITSIQAQDFDQAL